MKNLFFFSSFSLFLLFISCNNKAKAPTGSGNISAIPANVKIKTSLWSAGMPLTLNQTATDTWGRDFRLELLKYYLSDITLYPNVGDPLLLKDVLLFNFDNQQGREFIIPTSTGTYGGISFGIGLNPQQNAADPATYPPSHPLSVMQNTYWTWATKYRFIMIDGKGDSNGDGTFDVLFSYHAGDDLLYETVYFPLTNVSLTHNTLPIIEIKIDIDTFFDGPNDSIDFVTETATHSTNPLAFKVAANFKEAISIDVY